MTPDLDPAAPHFTLYEGGLELWRQQEAVKGPGFIRFEWMPYPRFTFRFTAEYIKSEEANKHPLSLLLWGIELAGAHLRAPGLPKVPVEHLSRWVFGPSADGVFEYAGAVKEGAIVGENTPVSCVRFLLPNAANLFAYETFDSIELKSQEWDIKLTPVPNLKEVAKAQGRNPGYAICYQSEIRRPDGAGFRIGDTKQVLDVLAHLLSFANARWTGPLLPTGYADDTLKWRLWSASQVSMWGEPLSWYSPFGVNPLHELFPKFMTMWKDPWWQKILHKAVSIYVNSRDQDSGENQEQSILLLQTALEMLAKAVLVNKKGMKLYDFDKMCAAEAFTSLFKEWSIPIVSDERVDFQPLLKFARKYDSVPGAMTRIRNLIAHPEPNRNDYPRPWGEAVSQAKQTYLWFLELGVLRLLGFQGEYYNRLHPPKPPGAPLPEEVPWMPRRPPHPLVGTKVKVVFRPPHEEPQA
jgi:hypothetical protein